MITLGVRLWVEVETVQEGETWSAFCNELQLASAGQTEDEAVRNLMMTVQAYANVLKRRGVLEQVLRERNIQYENLTEDTVPPNRIPVDVLNGLALVS